MESNERDVESAYKEAKLQLQSYLKDKKISDDAKKIIIILNSQKALKMEEIQPELNNSFE